MENLDDDVLEKIGGMMGHDRNTMNQVKQMMKNPEAMKQVKKLMNKQMGNPEKPIVKKDKVGRNDPCPCGSGKKSKKCCHS